MVKKAFKKLKIDPLHMTVCLVKIILNFLGYNRRCSNNNFNSTITEEGSKRKR